MHIWPFLISLVPITLRTFGASTLPGAMMAGHLPPSSSVTGTRFSAAALATSRPIAGLPVYSRWSQRRVGNSFARVRPPTETATRSSPNVAATIERSSSPQAGV